MDKLSEQTGEIIIYQDDEGKAIVDVTFADNNLWLSLKEISQLFGRDKSVISRHLHNIFKDEELIKDQTVAFFATVQDEGGHLVERNIEHFNLDVIISVGYRVNSKRGTHFRKWASFILKDYLLNGYVVNKTNIAKKKIQELQSVVELLTKTLTNNLIVNDLGLEISEIINNYAKVWDLLLAFDEDRLAAQESTSQDLVELTYVEARSAIDSLKKDLSLKNQSSDLFGIERTDALLSILGNIAQSFCDTYLYPSNLRRAAHLLYFIIKDHPFTDGNKRIACLLFLLYLKKAEIPIKFDDNALIAITLLMAESNPAQKDIMVELIISLLTS